MSKTSKDRAPPRTITQLVTQLAYRHSAWQVFADFVEMGATTFSNAADLAQRDAREARYMEIVRRYNPDEVILFPEMLGALVVGLEEEPEDILGRTYHELELHNKWAGQYFTPFPLCRATANDRRRRCGHSGQNFRTRISDSVRTGVRLRRNGHCPRS